jgi:hypothetical protein
MLAISHSSTFSNTSRFTATSTSNSRTCSRLAPLKAAALAILFSITPQNMPAPVLANACISTLHLVAMPALAVLQQPSRSATLPLSWYP